jgi:hypothetical protein
MAHHAMSGNFDDHIEIIIGPYIAGLKVIEMDYLEIRNLIRRVAVAAFLDGMKTERQNGRGGDE